MDSTFSAILSWKPYASIEDTKQAIIQLEKNPLFTSHHYFLALPLHYLAELKFEFTFPNLSFGGAQMNSIAQGSFTEPIAITLLKSMEANFVIIGSSENRKLGREDEAAISLKLRKVLDAQITPFLCVGEHFNEYETNESEKILKNQIEVLKSFSESDWEKICLVYEAPWINETTWLPEIKNVEEAYQRCTRCLLEVLGPSAAKKIKVFCAMPEDVPDCAEVIRQISCPGWYFAHAALHLEILSKGLHLSFPSKETTSSKEDAPESTQKKGEEVEAVATGRIVEKAVLAAAQETEATLQEKTEAKEIDEEAEEAIGGEEEMAAEEPEEFEDVIEESNEESSQDDNSPP